MTEKEKQDLARRVLANHYDDEAIEAILKIRKERQKKKANVNTD